MPSYTFQCVECGPFTVEHPIVDPHPDVCPTCGNVIARVIDLFPYIAAKALATKGVAVRREAQSELNLTYDMDAYKRLRKQGLQPPGINNSYDLERKAQTQFEIDYGKAFPNPRDQREIRQGVEIAAEIRDEHKTAGLLREL